MSKTTSNAKVQAVIYARDSSKEQEKEGFSIPAQMKLLTEYAGRKGFSVVADFKDVETAKQAGRTKFNEMVGYLEEHSEVRAILVEKTDRLYRNFKDYVILDDLDLEIHLVKEGEVLSKASKSHQKFIHGIKVLMAKNYCDNLSEETKKGMNEKAAQGGYPHKAPIGYLNDQVKHTIIVDPPKAAWIRKMFEWWATGDFSLEDIRQKCIASGFVGGRGSRAISKSKVELILKSTFYVGRFKWQGKLYQGTHEPIISQDLFDRAQEVFEKRKKKSGKYREHAFAFGGLITCGVCGCAVTAEIQKGKYVYYHCTDYHRKCDEPYYPEAKLEGQFDQIVQGISIDEETVEWLKKALKESLEEQTVFHDQAVADITKQLEQVKRRMNQAYLDRVDGKITEEFWTEKSNEWQEEKARLMAHLARHQEADDRYLEEGVQILELTRRAYILYKKQTPAEKRQLLGLMLSNCTLEKGKLAVEYKQPFDILADMAKAAAKKKPADHADQPVLQEWGE